jgi:type VI secretion system protein ImpA
MRNHGMISAVRGTIRATPFIIQGPMTIVDLLKPINGASPCGEDMSFSTEFDQIAESRREDDPTLNQGEWVTALKVADWNGVVHACQQLLSERTKDLRLTMWLTEALMMTRGHEGLHEGLSLCTELCERYWDDVHPQAEDGDMAQRAGNIAWLLQRLVHLTPTRPITQSRQGAQWSLQDWMMARAQQGRAATEPGQDDRVTAEQFLRALRETPREWFRQTLQHARQSHAQLLKWQALIDDRLGDDGPSFVPAKEALTSAVDELERLARELGINDDAQEADMSTTPCALPTDAVQPNDAATPTGSPVSTTRGGPVQSRAQALQQLREVASYFRRTEPHSPVAYLADKAVSWAEMPLHEWLRHVVKDQGSMSHLQELLGIAPESSQPPY